MSSILTLLGIMPISSFAEDSAGEDVSHLISRAEKMFACYEYFRVAGNQRQLKEEKKRYKQFSKKSEKYGKKLLKEAGIKGKINELNYKKIGRDQNIVWIKEIGKDSSGERLKEVTLDCVQSVQREELAGSL
jgi:predicted MPP superfamily phosphohydrolase